MPVEHEWEVAGKKYNGKINMSKAIRQKCLDCSNGSPSEVKNCNCPQCALFPFRMGKDPGKSRIMTPEQKKAAGDRLRNARSAKKSHTAE